MKLKARIKKAETQLLNTNNRVEQRKMVLAAQIEKIFETIASRLRQLLSQSKEKLNARFDQFQNNSKVLYGMLSNLKEEEGNLQQETMQVHNHLTNKFSDYLFILDHLRGQGNIGSKLKGLVDGFEQLDKKIVELIDSELEKIALNSKFENIFSQIERVLDVDNLFAIERKDPVQETKNSNDIKDYYPPPTSERITFTLQPNRNLGKVPASPNGKSLAEMHLQKFI